MRAAELPLTKEMIFPFLMTKPMWPVLSLCMVTVRWNGLAGTDSELGLGRGWGWTERLLGPSYSPVPDNHDNLLSRRLLHHPVGFVCAPSNTVAPINLQDLVPKAQPHQGRGGVGLDQLHKEPLGEAVPTVSSPGPP